MTKPLILIAGVLLSFGAAVSATVSHNADAVKSTAAVEATSVDVTSKESVQILSLWKTHSGLAASVPLSRPL